jgi:uncharacterized protein YkwD
MLVRGVKVLKILLKILVALIIAFISSLYFFFKPEEPNVNLNEDKSVNHTLDHSIHTQNTGKENQSHRPVEGISTLIGKKTSQMEKKYGKPARIDPSAYDYDWWIYKKDNKTYFQAGVEDGKVVTIYAIGQQVPVYPFSIGEKIEDIFASILLNTEITVKYEGGTYQFELSEEDLNIHPLVQLGDIYAELSLDKFTEKLSSIRFMDKKTLIKQRPYEMKYIGPLVVPKTPTALEWKEIEKGSEMQIFDLSNIIRKRFNRQLLKWDDKLSEVAFGHSEDMYLNKYFSHESQKYGDLSERLKEANVFFQIAGENIAAKYTDGPAAMEGWLNSEDHRSALLENKYNYLGVGVYQHYFTQNFIEKD